MVRLKRLADQQAAELAALRQQVQQQQQQPGATPGASSSSAAGTPAVPAPTSAATPSTSRLGQAPRLEVPGSGDSWVSFGGGGGRNADAPTPTLLQPAGGSFRGNGRQVGGGAASSAAEASSGSVAMPPVEEALRAKLDLSSASLGGKAGPKSSAGLLVTPRDEQQRPAPMRQSSSGMLAGAGSGGVMSGAGSGMSSVGSGGGANGTLRSYPVQLTPGASPLGDAASSRSAPPSAQPSPLRTASSIQGAASGAVSPLPGSPMHPRPESSLSGRSLSPSKHRRNLTAPDGGFFSDLDPLGH